MTDFAIGQIWRVKKSGSLRRITRLKNHGSEKSPYYDISWETYGEPKIRRGATYQEYFLKNCELMTDLESEKEIQEPSVGEPRFCPVCARDLLFVYEGYDLDGLICTCCNRPWEACPCTPIFEGPCRAEREKV